MRVQHPVKGKIRQRLTARCIREIEREVSKASHRFDVSKSFVIAVALADYFGIENQEQYYTEVKRLRRIK